MVKERPIIFNTEMVQAILDGRKTQTRRVIKNPEKLDGLMLDGEATEWCPYGKKGDRLWVRETWRIYHGTNSAQLYWKVSSEQTGVQCDFEKAKKVSERPGWRPSIHIPRWASRINLEITDIRVERVQDISFGDAKAEGIPLRKQTPYPPSVYRVEDFEYLWDSINAEKGLGWSVNPWVWVIEFKKEKT